MLAGASHAISGTEKRGLAELGTHVPVEGVNGRIGLVFQIHLKIEKKTTRGFWFFGGKIHLWLIKKAPIFRPIIHGWSFNHMYGPYVFSRGLRFFMYFSALGTLRSSIFEIYLRVTFFGIPFEKQHTRWTSDLTGKKSPRSFIFCKSTLGFPIFLKPTPRFSDFGNQFRDLQFFSCQLYKYNLRFWRSTSMHFRIFWKSTRRFCDCSKSIG